MRNAFYAMAYLPVFAIRPIITGAYYINRIIRRISANIFKEKEKDNALGK
jgi:hypothetical protein